MSTFYRTDSLSASLPLQFAVVALVGLAATGICRSLFRLSTLPALAIAGIVMTSAIVNAIAREYRLEALIAVPVLLYLVWATARARSDSPIAVAHDGVRQRVRTVALRRARRPSGGLRDAGPCDWVAESVDERGVARRHRSDRRDGTVGAGISRSGAMGRLRNRAWTDGAAPAGLAVATLVMGGIAYVTFNVDWLSRLVPAQTDRRLAAALTVYAAIALMVANVAMHASTRPRAQVRIPAAWQNVERLQERPLRELTVKLTRDPGGLLTAMTRYYLPATKLHVIAPGARLA